MTEANNPKLFTAYKVVMQTQPDIPYSLHAYLVESTAPDNIDDIMDDSGNNTKYKYKLIPLKVDGEGCFIDEIADTLDQSKNPTLVISVHGFNNPRDVILPGFWKSFECVHEDDKINNKDVVCIGYRWPSEAILSNRRNIFKSSPKLLRWLFCLGVLSLSFLIIALIFTWYEHYMGAIEHETTIFIGIANPLVVIAVTLTFVSIPATLFLLRLSVYFRDGYRATSFGIPDLVEIIRQIDRKLDERQNRHWLSRIGRQHKRVQLSLIGHSMGGYVVTSVVRILSDVFDPATMREGLNKQGISAENSEKGKQALSKIGRAFRLKRLVLVSPDIPAEALISNRANFLSNSLARFEEAFLFSNEGDEVLRQISTIANYFSYPTKSNKYGYRLGNICILGLPCGISNTFDLQNLGIGNATLGNMYDELIKVGNKQLQDDLPRSFSYFDCTDCVEETGERWLTLAKPDLVKKMHWYDHIWLLLLYLRRRTPDVHGGYFRSPFLKKLIYRLACIGFDDSIEAYKNDKDGSLHKQCQDRQVRVLLKS
ncbi:MAG: alpha/beta hydrolase [Methylocella sp.]